MESWTEYFYSILRNTDIVHENKSDAFKIIIIPDELWTVRGKSFDLQILSLKC